MKRNDKRGISAIVATVLIIGITVGVIAIVGNFIIGMVQETFKKEHFALRLQLRF